MDKYTRVKKIGEGAFGKALLVKSNADGNQYVIKEINMTRMPPKEREASRKEVLVLAQLKHPHIVAYRESFEEHGSLYIVMDYCSGGDLYSKINSQRGIYFQEERIWTWFAQICLAIKHIHDRKILHRDIKSQNIFICGDGKVQIGDFGIAKVLNSTVELARTCIGTPYYLSPELVENKPYNNKSDIWSLGCVLYELTTLKHAFEAGNMKNLVLKIIRGSYPPIPTQYSYELRGLIAQLFKRSPRDRPSINSILKKNFMLPRVRKILSEEEMEVEFSHTVMHGHKMGRALPPPPRPSSAAAKRPAPQAQPSSAQGRYNPAAVYGQPLVKKSKDFKPNVKKRPGSAGRVIPGQQDWEKKKQNLVFKERKRREEHQKKEQESLFEKQHKELMERQKIARINRSREEGWKSIVESLGSDSGDDKISPREVNQQPVAPPRPLVNHNEQNAAAREKGKYDNYHAYLDKLQHDRPVFRAADVPQPVQNKKPGDYMQAPPEPAHMDDIKPDREFINRALNRPPAATPVVINHVQQAEQNRKYAAEAAERAKILEEFMQRKREAALNKMKGMKDLYGPRPGSAASDRQTPRQPPPKPGVQPSTPGRNREEQEYLQKLRQIREQNMKERRMLQNKYKPQQHDPKKEAEERRKKMQALRQQADDWAQKKKDQLEKEKKEIMDRMRLREQYMKQREAEARQQKQAQARPVTPKKVDMKPAPAVPITGALNAIGAGAQPEQKNPLQQKKNEILKRLNEKPPGGRGKWGAPASPMAVTEEDDEEPPVSARPKWGEAGGENLGELPLEQTASQMEVTSAQDQVIKKGAGDSPTPPKVPPRNQWGKPGGTVVGILQGMPICEGTVTIDTSASGGSGEGPTSPPPAVPGVGETITISKPTVNQGTIVIQSNQEKSNDEEKKKENAADVSIVPSTTDAASNADSHRLKGTFVIGEAKPFLANQNPETIPECCEDTSTTVMEEMNKSDEKGEEENISDEMNEKNDNSQNQQLQQNVIKDTNVSNENLEEKLEKKETSGDDSSKSSPEGKTSPISVDDEEESKEINMTDVSFEEDIHTDITTKHQQPLRLPKPKLLPKPVLPEIYFEKGPEIVKSEKGGSLFEKVELEDDEDEKKKNTADEFNKSVETEKFVCQAITTGQFDIKDIQMMRTVSEPDLSKINESEMKMPFAGLLSRHLSLDEVHEDNPEDQNEEEEEEMSISPRSDASPRSNTSPRSNASSKSNSSPRSDSSQKEIAKSASSPQKSDSLPKFHNSSKSEQTKPEELSKSGESKNKEENEKPCTEEESVSKHELNSSSENAADKMDENEDEEEDVENEDDDDDEEDDDLISVRATMQSLLIDDGEHSSDDDDQTKSEGGSRSLPISQETHAKSDTDEAPHGEHKQEMLAGNEEVSSNDASKDSVSGSADSEDISTEGNDLFDDSDAETLFGDDDDAEDYDLFSRLEQARQELEEALGFEKFIEVYKAVEALQEDEDDNVQEGARIVIEMLGKEKEHLYPRIFQLVIADTAFTDDNA